MEGGSGGAPCLNWTAAPLAGGAIAPRRVLRAPSPATAPTLNAAVCVAPCAPRRGGVAHAIGTSPATPRALYASFWWVSQNRQGLGGFALVAVELLQLVLRQLVRGPEGIEG